jgi:hypothetical protein
LYQTEWLLSGTPHTPMYKRLFSRIQRVSKRRSDRFLLDAHLFLNRRVVILQALRQLIFPLSPHLALLSKVDADENFESFLNGLTPLRRLIDRVAVDGSS